MLPLPTTTLPARPGVAAADVVQVVSSIARGHLMRSGVLRSILQGMGANVRTVTSTRAGAEFFACMTGVAPERVGRGWDMRYGDAHDLDVGGSIRSVAAYLASPWRAPAEHIALLPLLLSSRLVVNDIDPGLMLLQALRRGGRGPRLVNVISEHTLGATMEALRGARGGLPGGLLGSLVERQIRDCDALVVNTIDAGKFFRRQGNVLDLPPVVRATASRSSFDEPGHGRLIVAYLNPRFRSRALVEALVAAALAHGASLHLVSEHASASCMDLASPAVRIVPWDAGLGDLVPAADAVVTGAGLALPFQCYVAGTPLVAIVSDHPEHRRNAEAAVRLGMTFLARGHAEIAPALSRALDARPEPHPGLDALARNAWRDLLSEQLAE